MYAHNASNAVCGCDAAVRRAYTGNLGASTVQDAGVSCLLESLMVGLMMVHIFLVRLGNTMVY